MGNASSNQSFSHDLMAPVHVGTLTQGRSPVYDGTSGLNYSGRVYANSFAQMGGDLCKDAGTVGVDKISDIMPNSISSPGLPYDDGTKRIAHSALVGHVGALEGSGVIPGVMPTIDAQIAKDKEFYARIQKEYCFYEVRYRAAVGAFLSAVANPATANDPAVQQYLQAAVRLNKRLNSLLEIMNYVGNERARLVNGRSTNIESANKMLEERVATLNAQRDMLNSNDVKVKTQSEMIRFSAEKARAMNIQIATFVGLNAVALVSLYTVYRATA